MNSVALTHSSGDFCILGDFFILELPRSISFRETMLDVLSLVVGTIRVLTVSRGVVYRAFPDGLGFGLT